MSLDIRYAKIDPEQIKDSYGEYDTVDFLIATDRNLIANSIRIEGDLEATSDGTNRVVVNNDSIFYEPQVGIHGVVESISTQLGGSGEVVEFLQNYPRYVNMVEKGTSGQDDYFTSQKIVELKCPCYENSNLVLGGRQLQTDPVIFQDGDFSFKPMFCLNRMNGESLNLQKYNNLIKVSVQLARNKAFFCGLGVGGATQYKLKNLKLTYRTLPSSPSPDVSAPSYVSLKQTLAGNSVSISSRVPAVANGVSISFLRQAQENTDNANNYELLKVPHPTGLRFMFNSVENNFVTYEILDEGEMVQGFLDSMKSGGINNMSPTLQRFSSFGLGASFNGFVDLRNQKFTFELESGIDSQVPVLAYMYFHTLVEL